MTARTIMRKGSTWASVLAALSMLGSIAATVRGEDGRADVKDQASLDVRAAIATMQLQLDATNRVLIDLMREIQAIKLAMPQEAPERKGRRAKGEK